MYQKIVRVQKPPGLNTNYRFSEPELNRYGLTLVPGTLTRKYPKEYDAIRPYMLLLPRVAYPYYDYKKAGEDFGMQNVRLGGGSKTSTVLTGELGGEEIRAEFSRAELKPYRKEKFIGSFVYLEDPIMGWQDNERVEQFFHRENGWALKPFQYFAMTASILKDWNIIFPDDAIEGEEPDETSGLFYYQTF